MSEINRDVFVKALCEQNPGMPAVLMGNIADTYLKDIDPRLYPALNCWINRKPVENVTYGSYSLERIMQIRGNNDYLQAMVLLSAYMKDEKRGSAMILAPRR